jgi:hypothetical protein
VAGDGPLHARLVVDLADLLEAAGFGITKMDGLGYRLPPTYQGHRPDLVAEQLGIRAPIIGEAKLGPDLRSARSLNQLRAFSRVLVPTSPVTYAGLVVVVPGPWVAEAWLALRTANAQLAKTLVVGKWISEWEITFPARAGAVSWQASGPTIRVRSWPSGGAFSPLASGAGAVMSELSLDVLT